MIKYKNCNCSEDYWEEVTVHNDENYNFKIVKYFHCSYCGEDFRVEDFESRKEVYYRFEE